MSSESAYVFDAPHGVARSLARAWLKLGIAALIGSGLLAILLVLSRTPGIQAVFPLRDFFRAALVVHVDLSVFVWFMAAAAALWSVAGTPTLGLLGRLGVFLAATGTVLMVVSPFFPETQPLLNNYIPVLQHPLFFAGLGLAGAGFFLALCRALATLLPGIGLPTAPGALRLGALLAAVAGLLAWGGFAASWLNAPGELSGQTLYEVVFWGGGHTLQFQHALLMLVAWLWLASHLGAVPRLSPTWAGRFFLLAALPLLAVPYLYSQWPVGAGFHIAGFARLMEAGHPFMFPLIVIALLTLLRLPKEGSPEKSAYLASIALFLVGGILAYLIRGINVVIPAHYHGSIVGVTLAFMGLTYVLLPRLGYRRPAGAMARWQPYVYGGGQLLHILGLAWSGGYGVQRKVAGAEQVLTSLPQKIGMGLMGLGGLIAIIGGILFVVVCLKAMAGADQTGDTERRSGR